MFNEAELKQGVDILRDFGATKIILFGSAQRSLARANDLDLACRGIRADRFYSAAGQLLSRLQKPVDLIDLDRDGEMAKHVEKYGTVLYAQG